MVDVDDAGASLVLGLPGVRDRLRVLCARSRKQQGQQGVSRQRQGDTGGGDGDEAARPDWGSCVLWVSLAACASLMFLATTNQLCQDVAVVPLLWVLPLSLYLLSLVICFDRTKWYSRGVFHPALGLPATGLL